MWVGGGVGVIRHFLSTTRDQVKVQHSERRISIVGWAKKSPVQYMQVASGE
jgi:hypothetical protein